MTAKFAALRLLSFKSRSIKELRKKLTLKGYSPAEIDGAIADCERLGYLNDAEESRRRIEQFKRRGYGPPIIAYKLKEAGLKAPSISDEEQQEMIRRLLQKPSWAKKPREKIIAALLRRGFSLAVIYKLSLNSR